MWTGEKTNEWFTAFKMELQNEVGALHYRMLKVMEMAERKEGRITQADVRNAVMSQDVISDLTEMDRRLYQLLVACTNGEAKNYVCNTERSGFKAWKQMVSHVDPRMGADRSVAFSRVTHPVSPSGITPTWPKTLQASRTTMQAWKRKWQNSKSSTPKRVDEDAKILALKSIMPETLFGEAGEFRRRSFSTYAELCTSIIRYLDDKVPVSMMTKSSSSNVTSCFVQNVIEGEREIEEEDKDSITQEEFFAMVQQFRKGSGKGQSKGKGKGVCWNSGDGDHYSRDCPNDKQDSWVRDNVMERPARLKNQQRVQAKDRKQEKATGTVARAKGKSGNCMESGARRRASMEAKDGTFKK